jgi:hypothetical protein
MAELISKPQPWSRRIDYRRSRAGLPPFAGSNAHIPTEHVGDMWPGPIGAPGPKIMLDHGPWREVLGEPQPGTVAPCQIREGIENFAFRVFLRRAPSFGRGHEMRNQLPFLIREVSRIRLSEFHGLNCIPFRSPGRDFFTCT